MIGSKDLHTGRDLRVAANRNPNHIENDAVAVYEDVGAKMNVVAVVAVEWRPDDGSLADGPPGAGLYPIRVVTLFAGATTTICRVRLDGVSTAAA